MKMKGDDVSTLQNKPLINNLEECEECEECLECGEHVNCKHITKYTSFIYSESNYHHGFRIQFSLLYS